MAALLLGNVGVEAFHLNPMARSSAVPARSSSRYDISSRAHVCVTVIICSLHVCDTRVFHAGYPGLRWLDRQVGRCVATTVYEGMYGVVNQCRSVTLVLNWISCAITGRYVGVVLVSDCLLVLVWSCCLLWQHEHKICEI